METYPPLVQSALTKMTEDQKLTFESEYNSLLGKTAMGIFFWLTFGGFGLWWLIEWFLTPKRVNDYNREMSVNLARDTKMMA